MFPFEYVRVDDVGRAAALAAEDSATAFIAGGTDLLQLMKDDISRPRRVLDITAVTTGDLTEVKISSSGVRLGSLAKMSDVADHSAIRGDYPVVSQALLASASPQVRNMATIGGNILQRTRCPYFRDVGSVCNKREPGTGCAAINGENRLHAVLGGSDHCIATHASDLAVALVTLDAVVLANGPNGERRIPIETFHVVPGDMPGTENVLQRGELIVAVELKASPLARRSLYRKVRDRASFEFALASAGVAVDIDRDRIRDARVALGGVGTKPWRSHEAEAALIGAPIEAATFEKAATAALQNARSMGQNGFKIRLAHRTLVQALTDVSGA